MTHAWRWQPAGEQATHTLPVEAAVLAAPAQRAIPQPTDAEAKQLQRRAIHGHPVVAEVSTHDRTQPLPHRRNGLMQALSQFGFHLSELRLQALAHRLPQDRETAIAPLGGADVREAKEVERLGFAQTLACAAFGSKRPKLQQPGLLRIQLQAELAQPLGQLRSKPLGIGLHPESEHDIVRVAYDDHLAARMLSTPRPHPQVKRVVKVDIGQKRRCTAALGRTLLHARALTILQHTGCQPFLDEPHDAPVRDAMLDELHQPSVIDRVEETPDVHIEHPVHRSREQPRVERIQAVMLAASGTKPVREPEEVRFVDGVQHLDGGPLDDLVLQRGNAQRALPAPVFGDVDPANGLGSVRTALEARSEVPEVFFQGLAVLPPGLPVHARGGFLLETEVGLSQRVQVVDMVQQCGEPHRPIFLCCLTYPLERTVRTDPALHPERVLLAQVPFGQTPSLHPLRRRSPGLVRRLLRYYGSVRLPLSVHHRRTSLDFPTRPATLGKQGTSRRPREVFPYVHGVCDRAGSQRISRLRCVGCCLPLSPTASAPRRKYLSRLNTRPARTPVNASTPPLRATPHDSGPVGVASPLPYDSFIHNTSPVSPAH